MRYCTLPLDRAAFAAQLEIANTLGTFAFRDFAPHSHFIVTCGKLPGYDQDASEIVVDYGTSGNSSTCRVDHGRIYGMRPDSSKESGVDAWIEDSVAIHCCKEDIGAVFAKAVEANQQTITVQNRRGTCWTVCFTEARALK